ncbi:MAG TPA: ABC transporter permease [Candidatus Olsenella avistercoris]|nr:ABC transporter permease [Candidatus Olsenella avistercoris]
MNSAKKFLYPFALFIVILLVWQGLVTLLSVPSYLMPSPIGLAQYFVDYLCSGDLLFNTWTTIKEVVIGTYWGIILGIVLGYVISKVYVIERLLMPLILILQIAPKISLAPLFVLWFGLGIGSKVALVILVVSFPVMITENTALRGIDANYRDLLTVLGASKWQQFVKLEIPLVFASIMTGVKVSLTQAMTGAVIGEMIGAKSGLGYLLTYGNEMYDINVILCSVITLSLIGLLLYSLSEVIEKKVLNWM